MPKFDTHAHQYYTIIIRVVSITYVGVLVASAKKIITL